MLLTPVSANPEYVPFITMAGQAVHLVDHMLAGGHSHGDLYREAIFGRIVYQFVLPGSSQHLWYAAIEQELVERGMNKFHFLIGDEKANPSAENIGRPRACKLRGTVSGGVGDSIRRLNEIWLPVEVKSLSLPDRIFVSCELPLFVVAYTRYRTQPQTRGQLTSRPLTRFSAVRDFPSKLVPTVSVSDGNPRADLQSLAVTLTSTSI
jgi:hypothetical protein